MTSTAHRFLVALVLTVGLGYGSVPAEDQQPFTLQNLIALAGAGLGEKEVVDRVNARGVDFEVTPANTAELKKAGLTDGALKAVAAAGDRRKPAGPGPLSLDQLKKMKAAGLTDDDVIAQVEKRGVGFTYDDATKAEISKAGYGSAVSKAVEKASKKGGSAPSTTTVRRPTNDDDGLTQGADDPPPPLPSAQPKPQDPGMPMPSAKPPQKESALPMPSAKPPVEDDPLPMPKGKPGDDDPLPLPAAKPPVAKVDPAKPAPPKNPFPKRANPIDELAKTTEAEEGMIYGPRATAEKQKAVAELFVQVTAASGLKLATDNSKHITLIASQANITKFMPGIKLLEQKLEQRFPTLIGKGTDKRNAVIVLLDSQTDYRTWITAEYHALGMDKPAPVQAGQQAGGDNQLTMALNSRGSFLPFVAVQDLTAMSNDADRQTAVAYEVGYLYMWGIAEGHAPDCFVTGFANYCESLMYTNPMSRVISYEERQLAAGPQMTWVTQVKDAVQKRTVTKSNDVLGFSTVTMKGINYAEAWSLISYLTQRPKEFEGVVTALRDKNGAPQAIDAYYKLKDEQLNYQWQVWANAQN